MKKISTTECSHKFGCPKYVNRNCWLARTLNSSPSKRCESCSLNFSGCLFFRYVIISVSLVAFLIILSFIVEGRVTNLFVASIFLLVIIYGYFFNQSTEKIIEANFEQIKAKEALEALTDQLEEKVAEQTKDLKAKNIHQANLTHDLEKANIRLQELDKQKTEFLSIASHQLRTPLSVLKGYLELISDGAYGRPSKGLKKVLADLNLNNDNLVKLVDGFLDISRIEQGRARFEFKEMDLNDIIHSAINELRQKAKSKGLSIKWQRDQHLRKVVVDEEKIHNICLNFIDNAIKYSERGDICVETVEEDGGLSVKVKDSGVGFEKVDKVNFFQKFYRGNNVSGINVSGTGLGLYVCAKFIEAHSGKVWSHSPGLGKGSEFGFWLPYQKA